MNLETFLTSFSEIVAVAGQNIFPMVLPNQSTYPALTYQVVARTTQPSQTTAGVIKMRVQLESFAKTYAVADTLRNAVIDAVGGYRGQVGGNFVQNTQVVGAYDYFEDEIELYRLVTEIYIWFV